jgi:hypothetical protein
MAVTGAQVSRSVAMITGSVEPISPEPFIVQAI